MTTQTTRCACWVSRQEPVIRFQVRRGAHGLACPVYRASLDPVDAANDAALRRRMEAN